jgi:hypothetical protein
MGGHHAKPLLFVKLLAEAALGSKSKTAFLAARPVNSEDARRELAAELCSPAPTKSSNIAVFFAAAR